MTWPEIRIVSDDGVTNERTAVLAPVQQGEDAEVMDAGDGKRKKEEDAEYRRPPARRQQDRTSSSAAGGGEGGSADSSHGAGGARDGEEEDEEQDEPDQQQDNGGHGGIVERRCLWKLGRAAGNKANKMPQSGHDNKLLKSQSVFGAWSLVHRARNNDAAARIAARLHTAIEADIASFAARGELPHFDDTLMI